MGGMQAVGKKRGFTFLADVFLTRFLICGHTIFAGKKEGDNRGREAAHAMMAGSPICHQR